MGAWDDFLERIEVQRWGEDYVPRPGPAALDQFEAATGFLLPASYRQFILRFGPGELARKFTIAAPGYSGFRSGSRIDLASLNQPWRELPADAYSSYDDPERARRLVRFCEMTGIGDYYGWDPEDVRDPDANEYGIYGLWHGDRRVVNVAGSFREFVEDFLFSDNYLKLVWPGASWAREPEPEEDEPDEGEPDDEESDDDVPDEDDEGIPRHPMVFNPASL